MADTTAIAIVGIVVSGVVGPSVAAVWARARQRRQHAHDRALADVAELRVVLDYELGGRLRPLRRAANG